MLNEFKSKLDNGEFVYGVFVKTSDPMFNEIIGISGYDYVILDTEHGPTDIENQQNNIRACELRGILPIVRVPYIDDNVIGKALDIGAMGIQISQIRCAEDVKKVIKYAKFYPEGERGVCRFVRAADYSSLNRNAFFKKEIVLIFIIQQRYQFFDNFPSFFNSLTIPSKVPLTKLPLLAVLYTLAISTYSFNETLTGMFGKLNISANAHCMITTSIKATRSKSQLRVFSLIR